LIIGELGLASDMHGTHGQALTLDWQLRMIDEAGLAGATVFSWTDEWYVNDEPVDGWGFGLTTADRAPKPAVEIVSTWATRTELDRRDHWPTISVVVCAYNEERHLEHCLSSLARSEYPTLEVIVCDDGSTDRTLEIARSFPFRTLALPHGGLSAARNAGMGAATGEIIAYLDADATCDPEWLWSLARGFDDPTVVAAGGPNLPYAGAGLVERAVALSPGSPAEVLISDARAEHVPGCNMAFRVDALRVIGGFDARYTSAGDDVDVCWKLLDAGGEIAFVPAAQVWHRRRATIRAYLRQQRGYGRAERMLAAAHRHRFNRLGQARWRGAIYQPAGLLPRVLRPIVYHGHQGHAPFQHIVSRRSHVAQQWIGALLPFVVPAVVGSLALTSVSNAWWFVVATLVLGVVGYGSAMALSTPVRHDEPRPLSLRVLVGLLHMLQPFARVWGRARGRAPARATTPAPAWWGSRAAWLTNLERALLTRKIGVRIGGPSDGWDLEARLGLSWRARVTTGVAWQWTPMHRRRWMPPQATTAVAATATVLALGGRPLAWLVTVASIVVSVGSTWVLRRRLDEALSTSTVGARTDDDAPAKVSRSSIVESRLAGRERVS
jgi:glycosyltransferase involved in cell wall biosynthesis